MKAKQAARDIIEAQPLPRRPRYRAKSPKKAYMLSHWAQYAPFMTTVGRNSTARNTPSSFALLPVYSPSSFMHAQASRTSNITESSFMRYSSDISEYENKARKYIYGGL